jgi:hypothetical protein
LDGAVTVVVERTMVVLVGAGVVVVGAVVVAVVAGGDVAGGMDVVVDGGREVVVGMGEESGTTARVGTVSVADRTSGGAGTVSLPPPSSAAITETTSNTATPARLHTSCLELMTP